MRDDRVSHAYLFSGPRGTGKTSSARILAKALNCEAPVDGEPCGVCTSCVEITQGSSLNVHELDAASNNGVDAMRDLVAHAGLGTPGRWKVYIVDEVHMLSTAAANALLKTLEEPPSHVVFVLATTDPQKVPPTIRSRTQHLEFRLLGAETLHDLLESVKDEAGLDVDEEALEAAVRRGRGSARDALSALDQVVASGSADAARPELAAVIDALADGDVNQVLVALECAPGRGLGSSAARHRADRRPTPGLPRRSGARAVHGVGTVAPAVPVRRRSDGVGPRRAQHGDPGSRIGRYAGGARRAGRPRNRRRARGAARSRFWNGGAVGTGQRPRALAIRCAGLSPAGRHGCPHRGRRSCGGSLRSDAGGTRGVTPDGGGGATPVPRRGAAEQGGGRARLRPPRRRQAAAAPPAPDPVATAPPVAASPTGTGRTLDRDSLTEAWGDGILQSLPARAKARYASGRFVAVDDQGVHFALPNAAHREQCAEQQPVVEAALSEHFGSKVTLVLDIDDTGAPSAAHAGPPPAASGRARGGTATATAAPVDVDEDEYVDPSELIDDTVSDQASAAEARLLQAFPGASEVAE